MLMQVMAQLSQMAVEFLHGHRLIGQSHEWLPGLWKPAFHTVVIRRASPGFSIEFD